MEELNPRALINTVEHLIDDAHREEIDERARGALAKACQRFKAAVHEGDSNKFSAGVRAAAEAKGNTMDEEFAQRIDREICEHIPSVSSLEDVNRSMYNR